MSTLDQTRHIFLQTAAAFVDQVEQVPEDAYDQTGLGSWTVRDLIGHAGRAMSTVLTRLDEPADQVVLQTPASYFHAAKREVDPGEVQQRGVEAGAAITGPAGEAMRALLDQVTTRLDAIEVDADPIVSTPLGAMALSCYLRTRILELTVHSLDLNVATAAPVDLPADAMRITLETLADLAVLDGSATSVTLALAGRASLPNDFSVL